MPIPQKPPIIKVLKALRDGSFADSICVFGSLAKGKQMAGDVDIALDIRGKFEPWHDLHNHFREILLIARNHYPYLDPFLVTDHGLFVRDTEARSWTKASNARAIKKDIKEIGQPLKFVLARCGVAPRADNRRPLDNPFFKKWFGASKAVCEDGRPMVLFHGSGADTGNTFLPGTFFTAHPEIAEIYAKAPTRQTEQAGPNIVPVYLSLQNPFVFDDSIINDNISHHILGKRARLEVVFKKLAADGYDGLIIKNYHDLGGIQDQYVVFRPEQVRSAIGHARHENADGDAPHPVQPSLFEAEAYEECEAPHG